MTWNDQYLHKKDFSLFCLALFDSIEKNVEYLICHENDVILFDHFLNLLLQSKMT
jgi:hypothetical protein